MNVGSGSVVSTVKGCLLTGDFAGKASGVFQTEWRLKWRMVILRFTMLSIHATILNAAIQSTCTMALMLIMYMTVFAGEGTCRVQEDGSLNEETPKAKGAMVFITRQNTGGNG